MRVTTASSAEEAGALAAVEVAAALAADPDAVLGVATGSSPGALYRALARDVAAGRLDLARRPAYALDEYVGLASEHPESYRSVVERDVTVPLRLDPARVHVPDGTAVDLDAAAADYERAVRAHERRVQVIGIGANGHIGFNEPGSSWDSRTRVVELAADTRAANSRFFPSLDDVPTHAVTQGISTILTATTIVLVAHGTAKAEAVAAAVHGLEDPALPASALQRHPDVRLFLDTDAAHLLQPIPAP